MARMMFKMRTKYYALSPSNTGGPCERDVPINPLEGVSHAPVVGGMVKRRAAVDSGARDSVLPPTTVPGIPIEVAPLNTARLI